MNDITRRILERHYYWCTSGYTFLEISDIGKKMYDTFDCPSTLQIERYLMTEHNMCAPFDLIEFDLSKITFLYINDSDFDGNIDFISDCVNLTHIELTGLHSSKITSIEPLRSLSKVKYLDIRFNAIDSLLPISSYANLVELKIGSEIKSIAPITSLNSLKTLDCVVIDEVEVLALLQNSPDCVISYSPTDDVHTNFTTLRINDLFFKCAARDVICKFRSC